MVLDSGNLKGSKLTVDNERSSTGVFSKIGGHPASVLSGEFRGRGNER